MPDEWIDSQSNCIIQDFSARSEVLLIAFGGIKGGLAIPVFEFFNLASCFMVNKLFIRDIKQSWYQRGISSEGVNWGDIDAVASLLTMKIQDSGATKVIMVGNSAGGFAALLFGTLLEVDAVLAFAPQTFVDARNRMLHMDFRWRSEIREMRRHALAQTMYLDLANVFQQRAEEHKTHVNIYYDVSDRLDRIHSERMKKFNNVTLYKYKNGGHNLIKYMKDNGDLLKGLAQWLS